MLPPEMKTTPVSELDARIGKLRAALRENRIDGALILQNMDFYYFTGTIQQGQLYVPADGEPLLMVRKSHARAVAESGIGKILPFKSLKEIPGILKDNGHAPPKTLGMELDVLPAAQYLGFTRLFENSELVDVSHFIRLARAVKSDYEIGLMEKAANLADQVAESVPEFLKEGMTEVELAGLVEARARKLGHQGTVRMRMWGGEMFYGHLMAGPSAAVPSFLASPTGGTGLSPAIAQSSGFRPIGRHEPVLVDYVFAFDGYLSDHARIFSIGELPDDLMRAHDAMLKVNEFVMAAAKPGAKTGDLYEMAVEKAGELGYADNFMGADDERIRFVGHGLGLELDEYPFLAKNQKTELEEGMVFALEPKVIFPGKGVVGIENTHVVTNDGLRRLTRFGQGIVVV